MKMTHKTNKQHPVPCTLHLVPCTPYPVPRTPYPGVLLSFCLFILLSLPVYAQNTDTEFPVNLVYQSSMVGIGGASVYDTYLSPQTYTGTTIGLLYEQIKMTGLMNGRISSQHLFNLDIASVMNPPGTNVEYTAFAEYGYAMHYRFEPAPHFQLFTGAQINGLLGGIYNLRNGNNPATMKANINVGLSAIAAYRLQIKEQPLKIRFQLNMPVAGVLYSLHYGQSYYEVSLGDDDNLFHFASFHNQLIMRNLVTVELPFKRTILRLTYMNSLYETDVNDIQTKLYSNSFFIGLAKNFYTIPGRKTSSKYHSVYE